MIKGTILFAGLLALASAAILYTDGTQVCQSEHGLWGSMDGTKFYFCIGDQVIEQSCPKNTFFVQNSTVSGCVPLTMVDPHCVTLDKPQSCEGEQLQQPQSSQDPTKYYLCPAAGATPVLLSCGEGKAFVHQDGYLGCFDWDQWRTIRQCPE